MTNAHFFERQRVLLLGVPAFLVVLGAISLEEVLAKRVIPPLSLLGDASYSLYLFHPIATAIVAIVWARLFGGRASRWIRMHGDWTS